MYSNDTEKSLFALTHEQKFKKYIITHNQTEGEKKKVHTSLPSIS